MSFRILGLGTAVPRHAIEQTLAMEWAKQFSTHTEEQRRLLPVLYRRTGVKRRHSVVLEVNSEAAYAQEHCTIESSHQPRAAVAATPSALALGEVDLTQTFFPPAKNEQDRGPTTSERMERYARHASELAIRAAAEALQHAGVARSQITHLVTVSCTGFQAPGVDLELIRELGLPVSIARSHVGFMGCHGALNGLRIARAFAESESNACILMVAVELCSLHQQYGWQPDRIVANSLFADGAAAIIGCNSSSTPSPIGGESASNWQVAANGSLVLPDSEDVMSWRIGDHGFSMTLSPLVPDRIRQSLKPWLVDWLKSNHLALEEIRSWAIHPGGPRILSACGDALDLDPQQLEPAREILSAYGNMSSPTVLFILKRLIQADAPRPCLSLAFGPGLAIETMLIV